MDFRYGSVWNIIDMYRIFSSQSRDVCNFSDAKKSKQAISLYGCYPIMCRKSNSSKNEEIGAKFNTIPQVRLWITTTPFNRDNNSQTDMDISFSKITTI